MPVPLPYPKAPQGLNFPASTSKGVPKFKNLWKRGPKPIQPLPNYADEVPQELFQPPKYRGPMSPRAGYVRFLKQSAVHSPEGIAPELLQTLQGGGEPLDPLRRLLLRQITRSWLGR